MAIPKSTKEPVIDFNDPHEAAHHARYSPEGVTVTLHNGDGPAVEVQALGDDLSVITRQRMSDSLGYRINSPEHQRIQNLEARFLRPAKMNAREAAAAVIEEWVGKGKP
ncbi:hypothetical protein [Pantoea phage Nafs113]|nr:hypothetical protein [Pantoea phage Nafs113]